MENNENQKKCSFCEMDIPLDAGRCSYCGSLLKANATEDLCREVYRMPNLPAAERKPLSNGLKVFLTVLFTIIPCIGQLAGIITAIALINTDDDADRKSFGVALLTASIIMFLLSSVICFVMMLALMASQFI